MMRYLILAVLILFTIGVGGYIYHQSQNQSMPSTNQAPSPSPKSAPVSTDWERFEDSVIGYSIRHPSGWYTRRATTLTGESSITSFDVQKTPNTGGVPLEELKVGVVRFLPEGDITYNPPDQNEIVDSRQIIVAGQQTTRYRVRGMGIVVQVPLQRNGQTYVISAYPADSQYIDIYDRMLETFTFVPGIQIESPAPRQEINSPLTISGRAPGPWFFEGQIQARLESRGGNLVSQMPLQATAQWMTKQQVPFEGRLEFTKPNGATNAVLIISNSNPSGLPENDRRVRIPVSL